MMKVIWFEDYSYYPVDQIMLREDIDKKILDELGIDTTLCSDTPITNKKQVEYLSKFTDLKFQLKKYRYYVKEIIEGDSDNFVADKLDWTDY